MTKVQAAPVPTTFNCSLCGAGNTSVVHAIPGYRKNDIYKIYDCSLCGAAMAAPRVSQAEIYQQIYSQPERIPGYARYAMYARVVESSAQPLAYLAAQEECYWAIADALQGYCRSKAVSILEVGCGMGYLTCALKRDGYERVLGIDLSSNAIEAARARYGDWYRVADVLTFAGESDERFDAVVLSEVIEHLENPESVVAAARLLLKPGGVLICTTPNRNFGGWSREYWATDLPPVHLWWFGERAMRMLAHRCGLTVSLTDFTQWNRKHYRRYQKALQRSHNCSDLLKPMLDSDGSVLVNVPAHTLQKPSVSRALVRRWQNLLYRLRFPAAWVSPSIAQSPCIGAVFRDPGAAISHDESRSQ